MYPLTNFSGQRGFHAAYVNPTRGGWVEGVIVRNNRECYLITIGARHDTKTPGHVLPVDCFGHGSIRITGSRGNRYRLTHLDGCPVTLTDSNDLRDGLVTILRVIKDPCIIFDTTVCCCCAATGMWRPFIPDADT